MASPSKPASKVRPLREPGGRARSDAPYFAFTRAELLVIVTVFSLLALVVLPVLANNRPRSNRVICANNLRQIGMAVHLWGSDHGDRPPWEVAPADGGTMAHALAPNAWFHFALMSNELASPKVLFCPSDSGRPAEDFSADPSRGYLHPNFRIAGTSYFLSEGRRRGFSAPDIMSGDRNVPADSPPSNCPRLGWAASLDIPVRLSARWSPSLHNDQGNLLGEDGSVAQATSSEMRTIFNGLDNDVGSPHVVLPR